MRRTLGSAGPGVQCLRVWRREGGTDSLLTEIRLNVSALLKVCGAVGMEASSDTVIAFSCLQLEHVAFEVMEELG